MNKELIFNIRLNYILKLILTKFFNRNSSGCINTNFNKYLIVTTYVGSRKIMKQKPYAAYGGYENLFDNILIKAF